MGTHPIFESDFDCLTDERKMAEIWNTTTIEDHLEEFSWVIRLSKNLCNYLIIIIPIALIKICLDKLNFKKKDHSSYLSRILYAVYYGSEKKLSSNKEQGAKEEFIRNTAKLAMSVVGIWGTLITYGVFQERVIKQPYELKRLCNDNQFDDVKFEELCADGEDSKEFFKNSQFLVLFSRFQAMLISGLILLWMSVSSSCFKPSVFKKSKSSAPFYLYSFCSLSNILSSWFNYESLKLVSFVTTVAFKGSKILPVMIMHSIVNRKKHGLFNWLTACMLGLGCVTFMLFKDACLGIKPEDSDDLELDTHDNITVIPTDCGSKSHKNGMTTTLSGVICLCLYIAFDSFTSNWQEKLFRSHRMSNIEMMFGVSTVSCIFTLTSLLMQGGLLPAFAFMERHPIFILHVTILALMQASAQLFIFYTIREFGAVVFIIIMTTRTIPQVFMSWLLYNHTFGSYGWLGIGIVFLAIVLRAGNTIRVYRKNINEEKDREIQLGENVELNRSDQIITKSETKLEEKG